MDDLAMNVNSLVMFDDSQINSNSRNNVSLAPNKHPRLDYYKKSLNYISNQEERRKRLLVEQKKKRDNLKNINRNIEIFENKSNTQKRNNCEEEGQSVKKTLIYDNQLMFSEWFEEIPIDFDTQWIMVVCPVGKRCLVVAMNGTTIAYTKNGKQICQHLSKLPGGNKEKRTDYSVLDCIFSYELQTYFVLDVLVFKSHPIIDSEAEFRFFWWKCKLNEIDDLNKSCYGNPYKFKDLPRLNPCNPESIKIFLEKPFDFEMDGLLFYQKEVHYSAGFTPLVLWLKPYMLEEIFDIPLSNWLKDKIPKDYKNYKDLIEESNVKQNEISENLMLK